MYFQRSAARLEVVPFPNPVADRRFFATSEAVPFQEPILKSTLNPPEVIFLLGLLVMCFPMSG